MAGEYGSLTLVDGAWTYTADSASIQSLADGDTATDTITVTASDGTTQDIVITIAGTDDAAVVTGDTTGSIDLSQDGPQNQDVHIASDTDTNNVSFSLNDYVNDAVDDVSDTDDKETEIKITSLPEGGTLYYIDENNNEIEVAIDQTLPDDASFVFKPDLTPSLSFSATQASTHSEISGQGITITGFSYTGEKPDGDSTLTQQDIVSSALGLGIGTDKELSSNDSEVMVISFDADVTDVNLNLTGLGLHFSESYLVGADVVLLAMKDGQPVEEFNFSDLHSQDGTATINIETLEGFDEIRMFVDSDVNAALALEGIEVVEAVSNDFNSDFTYQTIDSDGNISEENTVSVSNSGVTTSPEEATPVTVSGTLSISDADDGQTPSFEDTTIEGMYGVLELVDGEWTYTVDPAEAAAIGDEAKQDVFTLEASDGTTQDIVISVTGVDDAAVITGDTTGSITEDVGAQSVSGTLNIVDPDTNQTPTFENETITGEYGTLTMVDGEWTYTVDPDAVQSLAEGEAATDTITVTASDGTSQDIEISLTGTDDAAQISGTTTGAVTEGDIGDVSTATGEISIVDPDGDPVNFPDGTISGEYGSLTLVDGAWTYTADSASIQSLADGDTATDTITVTASDGTTQDIVITITGTDDAAVVTGDTTGSITEDVGAQSVSGTLNIVDPDTNETPTFENETITGEFGSLTMVDGEWTYTVDSDAVQSLTEGEAATDTITVTASDGTSQDITISLTGTDDAAQISGTTTGSVSEGDIGDVATATGELNIVDPDGDPVSFPDGTVGGEYGSLTLVDGAWTYTLDQEAAQSLNQDQEVTDTITVTASDGSTQDITITVTGTNDAAEVSGTFTASVDTDGFSLNASESGNIQAGDAETSDSNGAWTTTTTTIDGVPYVISTSFGYDGTTIISRVEDDGSLTETDRISYDSSAGTVTSTSSGDITDVIENAGVSVGAMGNGLTQSNVSNIDGQDTLFLTSQNSGSLSAWEISSDGTLSLNGGLTFGNSQTGIVRENVTFEADDGTEYVFVARPQGDSVDTLTYNPETGEFAETGNSIAAGDLVSGVDIITVDGQSFLASSSDDGINIYSVDSATGNLTLVDSQPLDLSDGNSVNFYQTGDGTTYAIASSDGSDNASIFEVGANGSMTLTDTVSGGGAYMSSAGYVDGEPVFVMPNATEGVDLYTINDSGDLVLQTTITGIENDKTPPVIVQTSDGSYYLVDGDGQSTTVKLDFGNDADITVSGTLSISDADSDDSPSFENTTVEGEYGTLTLTEGVWTYTVDETKSQSIGEDQVETDTITLTATDGTTQDIVISVTGSNDASEITGDTTGSVTEDVGAQSVSGTLNIVDPDTNETPTFENETIAGEYGSLTMVDGEWTYTVDSDAVQSLTEGEAATDTITVTASDGTSQDIEISLTGTDDAAVVTGDTSASVTANSTQSHTIGNAFVMDQNVDYESGSFVTWSFPPELNFSDSGVSVQIVDNDSQLNSDDSQNETSEDKTQSIILDGEDYSVNVDYSLTYEDGAGNTYTFAVVDVDMNGDGSNAVSGTESGKVLIQLDGPEITPETSLSLVPDSYQNINSLEYSDIEEAATVSGTLNITDVDAAEAPAFENTTIEGEYGSLTLVDGEWTYTVDSEKAQSLGEDQTATDTITLTATDGTTQNIDITVSGVDEVAVVSGDTTGNISTVDQTTVETSVTRGSEGMWETSGGDSMTLDFSHVTTSASYDNSVGYYVLDAEGNVLRAEIIFDDAHDVTSATANINTEGGEKVGLFIIPDGDSKGFNAGEVTLSFGSNGVTAYQGYASGTTLVSESSKNGNGFDYESNSGSSSSWEDIVGGGDRDFNDVSFTVNASQDVTQNITTSGSITISDVDEGQTPTLPNTTVEGEYGSLTLVDGEWTYTLDPELGVAVGEESIDTIVITASDGSQHEIVISIAGTDDAPVVSGVFTGVVNEGDLGDTVSISGSISITDVDSDDTPEFQDTTVTGQYGSLDLVDGVWTYTVDNEKTQELDTGSSVKDTITLTASDGTTQNIEVTVQGTDDAPFVVGTNSAAIVAPEPVSNDFIEINNGFILNEGYSFDSGDMQYYGNEPTLNFNQAGQTIRIYDEDGTLDGDNYYNEYVQDTSQKVEIGGVMYTATYDYQLDYQDSAGNIYTFAVLDVDLDGDGSFKYDSNEQGKMIIQIDGPEITPGMSMDYLRDTPNQGRTMSYEDIAVDTAAAAASVTGQLSLTDVDAGDSPYFANNTVEGSYGSLELVDGSWTYTLNPDSTSHLQHNDIVTEVITLTASDGVTQTDVNITIGGSETALAVNSHSMTSESMSDVISLDDITFTGSDGDDKIAGSDAHDVLLAQAGDDLILGNGGNDILDGGLGNDILVGGEGNDTMAGGAGADTFAFLRGDQGSASEPATDHITDFDTQNDALNLSDLVQTEATESMESYLSLMDDGEGNATLSISSQGDGNVDQKVVFDNMSVENMADAYSVDIAGMTSEQVSSSVIDAMIAQSKVIID
ncbi:VCBS domain-containing protein [Enterovibrio norvegicus]|uniref:VCBS domain-containing protein n=1 Tax=Enterovibrio norvegicus TaxID=188144 RepID=UPI001A7E16F5|nr:VCBS domain-containing protein [Enterovibrio norvegicus]